MGRGKSGILLQKLIFIILNCHSQVIPTSYISVSFEQRESLSDYVSHFHIIFPPSFIAFANCCFCFSCVTKSIIMPSIGEQTDTSHVRKLIIDVDPVYLCNKTTSSAFSDPVFS